MYVVMRRVSSNMELAGLAVQLLTVVAWCAVLSENISAAMCDEYYDFMIAHRLGATCVKCMPD